MTTWKCTSCGAIDSRISNGDNACCSECGDPEGLVLEESGPFPKELLEEAMFDEGKLGSPGILDVGPVHWLAHKFGWNESSPVICRDENTTFIGFKCNDCGYISVRNYSQEVYTQQRRTDWPDDGWPTAVEPEYLKRMKQLPESERQRMIMGDPSLDLPEYCVCRIPERPLIDGVWCRECQGKVQEVTVTDLDNYAQGYVEQTPFVGRVIGKTDHPMWWIQSVKTGKQYELYEWQFSDETES